MIMALLIAIAFAFSPTIVPLIMLHRAKITDLSGSRVQNVDYDRAYPGLGILSSRASSYFADGPLAHYPPDTTGNDVEIWEDRQSF